MFNRVRPSLALGIAGLFVAFSVLVGLWISRETAPRILAEEDLAAAHAELKSKLARQYAAADQTVLSEAEIELRMAILRAVAQANVEYGDHRNPAYWTERDGIFVPRPGVSPCEAMLDLGKCRTVAGGRRALDGIYCTSLAQLLIMQGHLATASRAQRLAWDEEWRPLATEGFALPNHIPYIGESRFWVRAHSHESATDTTTPGFAPADLLPGDNIYIENPYLTNELAKQAYEQKSDRYRGEEGSNVFYLGAGPDGEGLLVHPFTHEVYTLDDYRRHMIEDWRSIRDTSAGKAEPRMFRITSKRSPQLTREVQ